ncbi:hypothetical protein U3516DRAFT_824685 [Neocallimastix sp. 'constans']
MLKLFYIFCTLLFSFITYCKILTIEDVLTLTIPNCKVDKDCPSESRGCIYESCFFKYYCRGNECISSTNTTYFHSDIDFSKKKKKKKRVIYEVCSEGALRAKKCKTPACSTNADCFSNYCLNNVCMSNDALPIIKCNNNFYNGTILMKCSKNVFEKCETNEECFSENCTKENYCSDKINNLPKYKKTAFFILKVFLSLCILSLMIYCGIFCCEHCGRKSKEEIYEEEEMYEEQEMYEEEEMNEERKKKEEEEEKEILKKEIIDKKINMNNDKIIEQSNENERINNSTFNNEQTLKELNENKNIIEKVNKLNTNEKIIEIKKIVEDSTENKTLIEKTNKIK